MTIDAKRDVDVADDQLLLVVGTCIPLTPRRNHEPVRPVSKRPAGTAT